jgi:amino acid permease
VSAATGHRIRWIVVWLLVASWFFALALNLAGNLVHLMLLGAIGILVYELLVEDAPA